MYVMVSWLSWVKLDGCLQKWCPLTNAQVVTTLGSTMRYGPWLVPGFCQALLKSGVIIPYVSMCHMCHGQNMATFPSPLTTENYGVVFHLHPLATISNGGAVLGTLGDGHRLIFLSPLPTRILRTGWTVICAMANGSRMFSRPGFRPSNFLQIFPVGIDPCERGWVMMGYVAHGISTQFSTILDLSNPSYPPIYIRFIHLGKQDFCFIGMYSAWTDVGIGHTKYPLVI